MSNRWLLVILAILARVLRQIVELCSFFLAVHKRPFYFRPRLLRVCR